MKETSAFSTACPCGQAVVIEQCWEPGGMNDYGGYVLKCLSCGKPFDVYLGRDIIDSRVVSGADVLARYDNALGNRDDVLKQFGLSTD